MEISIEPRSYEKWRTEVIERQEDAAYNFGYNLIKYCREEVITEF